MAETDIDLKVGLDSKDASARAANLQKEIQRIFNKTSSKKLDQSMRNSLNQMSRLNTQAIKLKDKLDAIAAEKIPTDEYKKLDNELETLGKTWDQLYMKIAKLEAGPQSGKTKKSIEVLEKELQDTEDRVTELMVKRQELEDSGQAFTSGVDTEAYAEAERQLNNLNNSIAGVISRTYKMDESLRNAFTLTLNPITNVGKALSGIGGLFDKASQKVWDFAAPIREVNPVIGSLLNALGGIPALAGKVFGAAGKAVQSFGATAGKVFTNLIGKVKEFAKYAASKAVTGIKKLGSNIVNSFKNGHKAIGRMSGSVGTLIKGLLGFQGITALIRRVVSVIKEGVTNLARWNNGNNETNRAISTLMSSLTQLKNAIGSAFAPIITAVAPALNTLIQLCISAANAVGKLFAALGGSSKFIQAKKVQQDYAKSLDKTGNSAKKAADKLGEYDELKVIEDDSGGGGGGGAGGLDPNEMFEEVPIDSSIQDLVDKIKDAWDKADFTEIGRIIGEKMKGALAEAETWLDETAKPFAEKLGKSIATFLNGFFETPGLGNQLGRTIGAMINTGLSLVNSFLDNTHFDSIGKFIGNALNGLTDKIDWDGIGHIFAQSFNSIFDILGGIAETWDAASTGKGIADAIAKAIRDFNWEENGASLSTFLNDLWTAFNQLLTNIPWKELGAGIVDFITGFFTEFEWSNVGQTISGLWTALFDFLSGAIEEVNWQTLPQDIINAIIDAISGLDTDKMADSFFEFLGSVFGAVAGLIKGTWDAIVNIGKAIKDAFMEWFTDNAFNEEGEFVIEGLLQGILDALVNIGTWIKEHIFDPIVNGFKKAFEIKSPSKVMEELGNFLVDGLVEAIKGMPSAVIGFFTDMKDKIKSKISSITSNAKKKFETMKEKVSDHASTLKDNVVGYFTSLWTSLSGKVKTIKDGVVGKFKEIKTNVSTAIKGMKTTVVNVFKGIWKAIKSPINSVLAGIQKFVNGIIGAMNKMIKAVNGLSFELPDWIPLIGGKKLGFTIPELKTITIPPLAKGAVIPPNEPFMALLGDQKKGTNIEAPLDTIVDAFKEVLGESGYNSSNNQPIVLQLNGKQIAQAVWDESAKKYKQTGNVRYAY